MLTAEYEKAFSRDLKRLAKKHIDDSPLEEVIALILENTIESREELIRHHKMHALSGAWDGSNECHVCNAGNWLLVWAVNGGTAYFQRTGTHDEIFR